MKKLMTVLFCMTMVFLAVPAGAEESGYALLIQQSPPGAGSVNLGAGVHKMEIGQTVALSAQPEPGYRFVYWLGDVEASDSTRTTVQVDSPKMVVAVFARDEFEEDYSADGDAASAVSGGGSGSSGRGGVINPITSPSSVNAASNYDYDPADVIYEINYGDDDDSDDGDTSIAVPGEEVPEPATLLLLGLGSTVLMRRKRS